LHEHERRKEFFQGWPLANFSTGNHKNFSREAKSDEISFFLLETKNTIFFAKKVIEKCQISKFMGASAPCPPLTPMCMSLTDAYVTQRPSLRHPAKVYICIYLQNCSTFQML